LVRNPFHGSDPINPCPLRRWVVRVAAPGEKRDLADMRSEMIVALPWCARRWGHDFYETIYQREAVGIE
jgi:hypothetical protein